MGIGLVLSLLLAVVSAAAKSSLTASEIPKPQPWISEVNKIPSSGDYNVKLDCLGCPLASHNWASNVSSLDYNRDNFLSLRISVRWDKKAIILGFQEILPLGTRPSLQSAVQVPHDPPDLLSSLLVWPVSDRNQEIWGQTVNFQLVYEHSVLETENHDQLRVQFDVKRLIKGGSFQPIALDKKGQKLVEILVNVEERTQMFSIESVEVVDREHRVRPLKKKCGRLAMVQTYFDPSEWDRYGKLGTWSRAFQVPIKKSCAFLTMPLNDFAAFLLYPISALVALGIVRACQWFDREPVSSDEMGEKGEKALLKAHYGDAPDYVEKPAIKIEEYA